MQVAKVKDALDRVAHNANEVLTKQVAENQKKYVSERLCMANARIGDTFTNSQATKYLNKVGQKATADWAKMHKVQDLMLKNSAKKNGAILSGIFAGVTAITAGITSLVKKAHANKE